jgi:predicted membrane protein
MNKETIKNIIIIILSLALIIGLVFISPILVIWALNVLFPVLAIPYTLNTWLAVNVLLGIQYLTFYRKPHQH